MKNIAVAIDGPAGAGKSTISKAVAQEIGFVYVDTGAMYRASALYAIQNNIKINEEDLLPVLDKINIDIKYGDNKQLIFLNGEDVSDRIRQNDVSMGASAIAVIPAVRLKLVDLQRKLAEKCSVIMDGRDIGSYVLPNAELKIYLTASIDERAKRRYEEIRAKNEVCDFEELKEDIRKRDYNDMNREFSPLVVAEDAIMLDTSDMSFEEVKEKVLSLIKEKQQ